MSAELIRKHFAQFLGSDVGVSFSDPSNPREVILYRPDRLSDPFVTWAFEQLAKSAPDIASNIDQLLVTYESRLGPTQRGVNVALGSRMSQPSRNAEFPN
jgi:hypothetical protein